MVKTKIAKFFKENKAFLAIVIGALIVGGAVYLALSKKQGIEQNGRPSTTLGECQNIPDLPDSASKLVTKVIDGDTFLIEGGYSVRILGIDADERGYPCYQAAKDRLGKLILNKKIKLEKDKEDKDQWCRYLRYVFLDKLNIGLTLVKDGLGIAYSSSENTTYQKEITDAENEARENKVGCKWNKGEQEATSEEPEEKEENLVWKNLTTELTGSKVVGACQAEKYLGKEVIIEGKIVDTYRSKTNTIFLNFGKAYPNQCFTGVIFSSSQYKFVVRPEDFYLHKTLRLKGEVKEYEGRAEIILDTPSQIEVGE